MKAENKSIKMDNGPQEVVGNGQGDNRETMTTAHGSEQTQPESSQNDS